MIEGKEESRSQDELAKIHRQAMQRYNEAYDFERVNWDDALDDLQFVAGEQWDDAEKLLRESANRPVITINHMKKFVRQVTNDVRLNKPQIKVRPVDDVADPDTSDVYEGLIRQIERVSNAKSSYVTGAENAARCGMGHWRVITRRVHDAAFDQEIAIRRITDPFAVLWDQHSEEEDKDDARFCFVLSRLPREEFDEQYPEAANNSFENNESDTYYYDWYEDDSVRIAEYFVKVPAKRTLWLMEDGSTLDATDIAPSTQLMLPRPVRTTQVKSHKVMWYLLSGSEVLEGPKQWPGRHIPIVSVWGEEIQVGERLVRTSVIRDAKDAQRLYNYWRTHQAELISLQPKAPFIGTDKQFAKHKAIWAQANKTNVPFLPYTPDPEAPGAPQRAFPPQGSQSVTQESLLAIDDMESTTGIFSASLGAKSNETSGVAITNRQREGDVSTFAYPDNLTTAIQRTGRILVDVIPRVYDTERMIRILGEDDSEDFVKINELVMLDGEPHFMFDLSAGRFDVTVDTGPSYTTRRVEAQQTMIEFIQAFPQHGQFLADLFADAMDWPNREQIRDRLRMTLPPEIRQLEFTEDEAGAVQGPSEEEIAQQQQLASLEARGLEADVIEKEASARVKQADSFKKIAEAEGEQLENEGKKRALNLIDQDIDVANKLARL